MSDNNKGASRLATVLQSRMKDVTGYKSIVYMELGTITATGLKLDNFETVIPNGGYMVCGSVYNNDGTSWLSDGTRVLVGWPSGEPVVVDIVFKEQGTAYENFISQLAENSSGTRDYEQLINKPAINDVVLRGNESFTQLGLTELTNAELEEILK